MSTYYDIKTGKWFGTLAELKSFQRGEDTSSPRFLSPKKEESKPQEPKTTGIDVVKDDAEEVQIQQFDEDEEQPIEYDEDSGVTVKLSREEMTEALRNAGVDGRSLSKKDDAGIAHMYVMKFGH